MTSLPAVPRPRKAEAVNDWFADLDEGIRFAVRVLDAAGIGTYESCQGGEGHCSPEPFVHFYGDRHEGFRAFTAAMNHGLPVHRLNRSWSNDSGELTGPQWQMTFRRSMPEWSDRHPTFQHIAIPLTDDGTWPGEPCQTAAFREARRQRRTSLPTAHTQGAKP